MSALDHVHHLVVWLLLPPEEGAEGRGISFDEVDIEADPAAAEFVGSVNGGNQTVPTVKFADGVDADQPERGRGQGEARIVNSRADDEVAHDSQFWPIWASSSVSPARSS